MDIYGLFLLSTQVSCENWVVKGEVLTLLRECLHICGSRLLTSRAVDPWLSRLAWPAREGNSKPLPAQTGCCALICGQQSFNHCKNCSTTSNINRFITEIASWWSYKERWEKFHVRGRSVQLGIRPAHNPGHSINVTKGSNDCEMGSNPALAAPPHWGQTMARAVTVV